MRGFHPLLLNPPLRKGVITRRSWLDAELCRDRVRGGPVGDCLPLKLAPKSGAGEWPRAAPSVGLAGCENAPAPAAAGGGMKAAAAVAGVRAAPAVAELAAETGVPRPTPKLPLNDDGIKAEAYVGMPDPPNDEENAAP